MVGNQANRVAFLKPSPQLKFLFFLVILLKFNLNTLVNKSTVNMALYK